MTMDDGWTLVVMQVPELKEKLKALSLPVSGTKAVLLERLRTHLGETKVSTQPRSNHHIFSGCQSAPRQPKIRLSSHFSFRAIYY